MVLRCDWISASKKGTPYCLFLSRLAWRTLKIIWKIPSHVFDPFGSQNHACHIVQHNKQLYVALSNQNIAKDVIKAH